MRPMSALAMVLLLACSAPAIAQPPRPASPIGAFVAEAAQRAGIPEAWIWAVMRVESAGDKRAVSRAGAMGLMQLMPATWTDLRDRYHLGDDPFDPHDNILAGAFFLRAMHDRYGAPGFLAAYNAGPGRYEDYLYRHRPLPSETTQYLARLAPSVSVVDARDPNAWMRSGLFAGREPSSPAAEALPPNDTMAVASATAAPIANPLFIRTSGTIPR